ncbi:type I-F CRISPR-associated protein Csy3 [Rhodocyclus tenuis]|uniref:type I-F CRISPR-associated protein Csy3 n=1 Tax=Rhodocyclus gracilis TaxID=2929842 RepID=UPI0012989388|nr:type I-F CRISPR-associated protein Csy3 [Rhodocyclus gracilis]MRD72080.1 type I-F CRISPR-associated protein Csy3 [Rhodocyclus gracilis]
MNAPEFKKLPGVLAFQRGLVITDALFFNVLKDGQTPVMVVRHGIRGTQNVNKEGDAEKSTAANAKRQEVSNIQTTDTAKLDEEAQALAVRFGLRFLDLKDVLFACAPASTDANDLVRNYRDSVTGFIERAKTSPGLDEVAQRFARNIANGRWLWRNRTIARQVEVHVSVNGTPLASFDALATPLNHFDNITDAERQVAAYIADGLRGDDDAGLDIEARLDFGVRGALEVFPSQNYVEDKPRGFARPLYCLGSPERAGSRNGIEFESTRTMGHAALRDQKIGNALRTIDTWYPKYAEHGRPLPVEPNGASLEAQEFFRDRKTSAFEFARRLNTLDPASDEGMFMIASLIRGGVFSGGKE